MYCTVLHHITVVRHVQGKICNHHSTTSFIALKTFNPIIGSASLQNFVTVFTAQELQQGSLM